MGEDKVGAALDKIWEQFKKYDTNGNDKTYIHFDYGEGAYELKYLYIKVNYKVNIIRLYVTDTEITLKLFRDTPYGDYNYAVKYTTKNDGSYGAFQQSTEVDKWDLIENTKGNTIGCTDYEKILNVLLNTVCNYWFEK